MSPTPQNPEPPKWPTQLAFALALALVIARATLLETVRETEVAQPGMAAMPRGPGPTTGLVLDLLLCVPALLVLLRRALDKGYRLRLTWSHVLFGALSLLAAVSGIWASDCFAAVVNGAHLVAAAVLTWSMSQLVRSWLRLRLVAAMCFGILLCYVAHGAIYRLIDVPDNIKYWEENKQEELRRRGWEVGSFQHIQFEKKIMSGEMVGFSASPNTFAAMLVMLGVITAGVVIQRLKDRDEPGWPVAIIVAALPAIWLLYYTRSRAALATPILAGGILAGVALAGPLLLRWRKPLYVAGASVFAAATVLLIGHGLMHGTLLIDSLTFRWRYWYGAAKIFEMHSILGVGWANFGLHYVGVRLPIAAEEVKDPHNLIVRAFVELGVIGGVLIVAWLARLWWELTAARTLPQLRPAAAPDPSDYSSAISVRSIFLISLAAMVINTFGSVDFTTATPDGGWFAALQILKRLLFLGLLLLAMVMVALRSSQKPSLDDRPAEWILHAILAGLAAFCMHNLIDFSVFEPGPMCVFAVLVGAALGIRTDPDPASPRDSTPRGRSIAVLLAATLLWCSAAVAIVVPIGIAEARAQRADEMIRLRLYREAIGELGNAFHGLWIDNSDYVYRAHLAARATGALAESRRFLDAAIAANPANVIYYRARAGLELAQPAPDAKRIIGDFERAIELDPNEVSAHLDFADALLRLGLRQRAIDEYRAALRYNDLLSEDEPKRLPPGRVSEIQAAIRLLE